MQINSGTVTITSGGGYSNVIGSPSVDWTQVQAGNLFVCQGATHTITSVNAGAKTMTISPAWAKGDVTTVAYAIVRDFSLNQNLPLLNEGDLEAAAIFTRAMGILDSVITTAGSTTNEILVTVGSPTTFIVGNALGFSASGWFLCRTDDATKKLPLGMVTFVAADFLSFKIKTEGRITSIAGITLTVGATYYLLATPVSGGGQLVNLTSTLGSAGSVLVPVLIADTSTSGYLVNLSSAQGAVFDASTNGLVPKPVTATGKFLRDDASWQTVALADNTIESRHFLKTGSTNWPNFLAGVNGLSVYNHIIDLFNRLSDIGAQTTATTDVLQKVAYTRNVYTWISNPSGTWGSLTVPAGVSYAIITLISNSLLSAGFTTFLSEVGGKYADLVGALFVKSPSGAGAAPGIPVPSSGFAPFMPSNPFMLRIKIAVTVGDNLSGTLPKWTNLFSVFSATPTSGVVNKNGSPVSTLSNPNIIGTDPNPIFTPTPSEYIFGQYNINDLARLSFPLGVYSLTSAAFDGNGNSVSNGVIVAVRGAAIVEWGNGAHI